jgi:biopolymer transport protein ExbB/TolQ
MDSIEDKEISLFGKKMSIGMIGLIVTVISSFIGMLWFVFNLYQKIESIEDMGAYNARLVAVEENTAKINDYTRDIKNDIKNDVRRLEKIVEQVERDGKVLAREVDKDLREMRDQTDKKIRRALDNPLVNKEQ